eukprot:TRINITY_DN7415_c0_g1_i1.p1 TRINITY_DN7415_c0_g1~~TRINITY_DN7415_c0_g1_i1.p1  ORF type:complete len:173 (-),score=21.80 TRINITY_DN7415_c0_g1_i1:43-561(-)
MLSRRRGSTKQYRRSTRLEDKTTNPVRPRKKKRRRKAKKSDGHEESLMDLAILFVNIDKGLKDGTIQPESYNNTIRHSLASSMDSLPVGYQPQYSPPKLIIDPFSEFSILDFDHNQRPFKRSERHIAISYYIWYSHRHKTRSALTKTESVSNAGEAKNMSAVWIFVIILLIF